jgi:hypothetical protein
MSLEEMERLRLDHESKKPFSVKIIDITELNRNMWVQIKKDWATS